MEKLNFKIETHRWFCFECARLVLAVDFDTYVRAGLLDALQEGDMKCTHCKQTYESMGAVIEQSMNPVNDFGTGCMEDGISLAIRENCRDCSHGKSTPCCEANCQVFDDLRVAEHYGHVDDPCRFCEDHDICSHQLAMGYGVADADECQTQVKSPETIEMILAKYIERPTTDCTGMCSADCGGNRCFDKYKR